MDEKHAEALSAFFDGEAVDAELLAESLSDPAASGVLADFAAMRAHVERDQCRPRPEFMDATRHRLHRLQGRRRWGRGFAKLAIAASLLLAVGVTGFELGLASGNHRRQDEAGVAATISPASHDEPHPKAPTPATPSTDDTRRSPKTAKVLESEAPPDASLRLRFGRWTERSSPVAAEDGGGTR